MTVVRHMLPISAVGIILTGACFIFHTAAMSPLFVGMAIMPLPIAMPAGSRLSISGQAVLLHGRSTYSNPLVWWSVMFLVGGFSVILQISLDPWQAWRLVIVAGLSLTGSCIFGYAFYKNRGVLILSANSIIGYDGSRFPVAESVFWLFMRDKKLPQVGLKYVDEIASTTIVRTILPTPTGINVNTLMSTIAQVQAWKKAAIDATPEQIVAMLRLRPPKGVDVGESVELPIQ